MTSSTDDEETHRVGKTRFTIETGFGAILVFVAGESEIMVSVRDFDELRAFFRGGLVAFGLSKLECDGLFSATE